VVWASPPVNLYETAEPGGHLKGLNADAFKLLIKSMTLKPAGVGEGVDLRPYVDEVTKTDVKQYINNKGEEVLPAKVIGRFEYPANTVYF